MARNRVKFHERGAHNDIKYSGPLSFQSFQILGWSCIVITVVMTLMKIAMKVNPADTERFATLNEIISYFAEMSLPFLLMANFARILNNTDGFKKQLLRNGGAMVAIFAGFMIFFNRYIVGTVGLLLQDPKEAHPLVMTSFYNVNPRGFFAFNIFIDLFLCTLVMFFMNARPTKVFTGKKIYIFRAFTLLPIAYEVICIILKGRSVAGSIQIPSWAFPLLTVKPPMTFLVFVFLAVFIKTRELRYCRHGKTHDDYQEFLKTTGTPGISPYLPPSSCSLPGSSISSSLPSCWPDRPAPLRRWTHWWNLKKRLKTRSRYPSASENPHAWSSSRRLSCCSTIPRFRKTRLWAC